MSIMLDKKNYINITAVNVVKFQQEKINFVWIFVYFFSQLNCQEATKSVSVLIREACQPEGIDSRYVELNI